MLNEIEVKGIQVFYYDCCSTKDKATHNALAENGKNYASGKVNRLKAIIQDHSELCINIHE